MKNNSLSLDLWSQIFIAECHQVKRAEIDRSSERLNIFVKGREEALKVAHQDLNEAVEKFDNNVQEVVIYFMKKHG